MLWINLVRKANKPYVQTKTGWLRSWAASFEKDGRQRLCLLRIKALREQK